MKKPNGYWTKEKILEDAKNFSTRLEWRKKSTSAYTIAQRNKLLNECCKHMIKNGYSRTEWTEQQLIDSAKPFKSRKVWATTCTAERAAALKMGIIDKCCKHMEYLGNRYKRMVYVYEFADKSVYVGLTFNEEKRKYDHMEYKPEIYKSRVYKHYKKSKLIPKYKRITNTYIDSSKAQKLEALTIKKYQKNGWNILNKAKAGGLGGGTLIWTKTKCIENAKKYKTRKEWKINSHGAYSSARLHKWIEDCCLHMTPIVKPKGYWTKKKCLEVSKTCKTKKQFAKSFSSAYTIALKNKWLKECCKHMIPLCKLVGYWTKKKCLAAAIQCKNKSDFKKKFGGAHGACYRNNWLKYIKFKSSKK